MRLFHTGAAEISEPDIARGRKNADFGQGFYLTPDMDFAVRWAGAGAVVNEYELNEAGLVILQLDRDEKWFDYICNNRRAVDGLEADVVIGPIANDTIFDTFGILSSGFLKPAVALRLLQIGPSYTQAAVKTERAVRQLRWLGAERITGQDAVSRKAEQDAYAAAFAAALKDITGREA